MSIDKTTTFHQKLGNLIEFFVHSVYSATKTFPKEEIFGATSQLRRSSMSVALNYTEGYARNNKKELANFLRISYGSLKESLYILDFAKKRSWIKSDIHKKLNDAGDEIGKMLWSTLKGVQ